jgi:hypothetical protein
MKSFLIFSFCFALMNACASVPNPQAITLLFNQVKRSIVITNEAKESCPAQYEISNFVKSIIIDSESKLTRHRVVQNGNKRFVEIELQLGQQFAAIKINLDKFDNCESFDASLILP